ncbi:MAG: PQQ-binding-like beta-propeller repeat protein [Myxococcaceae bacterium]
MRAPKAPAIRSDAKASSDPVRAERTRRKTRRGLSEVEVRKARQIIAEPAPSPSSSPRKLRKLAVIAALPILFGCASVPLYSDPTSNEKGRPLPIQVYDVDWTVKLVPDQFWEYAPREPASPSVDPETGRIIALTRDGYVRSLSPEGKIEWEFKASMPFNAAALVHDGVVYVAGADGFLYALNGRTLNKDGELLWKYKAGEELATTPVFANGKILVASETDVLYALDAKTGKWLWQARRDMPSGFTIRGTATPRVTMGVVYMGWADGTLTALDLNDGTTKWEKELASAAAQFADVDTSPVVDDSGTVYAASYKDGIYALSADNGDLLWHTVAQGLTSLVSRGDVLFGAGDGKVVAIHAKTGQTLWTLEIGNRYARMPLLVKGLLIVPTNGALIFVDPVTGHSRVSWDPGKGVSATPVWADSRLYVLSNLGHLYALDLIGRHG